MRDALDTVLEGILRARGARRLPPRQAPVRRAGCGCSTLIPILFLAILVGAIVEWPAYVDSSGTAAQGVIREKHEIVRVIQGDWFRHFEVVAAYAIPGARMEHRATCDVEEQTYDSLKNGGAVTVHYIPNLLGQPFIPATHVSPCTTMGSIAVNTTIRYLAIAAAALLTILILWRVLRIRIALWLLLPWLVLTFAYIGLPRTEPEPQRPMPATATVARIVDITKLGSEGDSRALPLPNPYQVVELQFVPPGLDTPVTAVDKIDENSVPGLRVGQTAAIVYDADHPRTARLQAGTRAFPGHTRRWVIVVGLALSVAIAIMWIIGAVLRFARRAVRI